MGISFKNWVYLKADLTLVGSKVTRKDQRDFPDVYTNVNLKFTFKSLGYLISPKGHIWEARSGPFGKGDLPNMNYRIGKVVITTRWGFKDGRGNGWFCPILPAFKFPSQKPAVGPPDIVGTVRSGFGIHPDGNWKTKGAPLGTRGCIGLVEIDTRSAKRILTNATGQVLIVRIATIHELTSLLAVD